MKTNEALLRAALTKRGIPNPFKTIEQGKFKRND
jgi:hypothetical protein